MEYNKLPEGHEGEQKRRTSFESPEEKLAYDAANLLRIARGKYTRPVVTVQEALDLRLRKDDDPEPLRIALALEIRRESTGDALSAVVATTEELSAANAEFLAAPNRRTEYDAIRVVLQRKGQAEGMPTFDECMEAMKKKGNRTLEALRTRTQDLRLTVAVIIGDNGKVKSFRPGLIEAKAELGFLRDAANPKNYTGQHYDRLYADLSPHGLREPNFDEYSALFATVKEMEEGTLIDRNGWTMLDMGNRPDKNAAVPLAGGYVGIPDRNSNGPDDRYGYLVSRPSVWGDDVPPKS